MYNKLSSDKLATLFERLLLVRAIPCSNSTSASVFLVSIVLYFY